MIFTRCRCQTLHLMYAGTRIARIWQNRLLSGMNPRTLQYLIGHSDISVTMSVYTHIGFDDAEKELKRIDEFRKAQAEVEQKEEKTISQKIFKVI